MPTWLPFVFAAAILIALVIAARRATTLLALRVEGGRVIEQRGRAPGEMLHDLADVVERARATGHIELKLEDGGVSVHAPDIDPATRQQIRNVVARFPVARLKTAPRVRRLPRSSA